MSELLTYLLNNEPQFRKARLAALYSDFRHLTTTNPDGYEANIAAWLTALSSASLAGVIPSRGSTANLFSLTFDEELLRALETKEWGRPLALGTVVREGAKRKELMPLREFKDAKRSVYHKDWAIRPWDILGWGLRQLGLAGGQTGEDKLPVGKFVVLGNLEVGAKELAKRAEGLTGKVCRIFSREAFVEAFGDVVGKEKRLSESDLEIFLKFLERDKGLLTYDGTTVKLKATGEMVVPNITTEDAAIASLKSLIKDLERQTRLLTERVDSLGVTARSAVANKNRVSALATLRSKKLAEATLAKRHATLAQLEDVFTSIEQAADQVELVRVMEASTHVLSSLNKQVGGVDKVDDVVDQLREQMSQVDEVGNVIAEAGQAAGAVDETEVDIELEAMERQEKMMEEQKEWLRRKEKEKQEAEETRSKLMALEEIERQDAEKNKDAKSTVEEALEKSTGEMKRMSLEPVLAHHEA